MRTSTFYKTRMPTSLKAAGCVSSFLSAATENAQCGSLLTLLLGLDRWIIMFAAGTVIGAENEGIKYDRSLWTGTGLEVEQELARREASRWDQMTLAERVKENLK